MNELNKTSLRGRSARPGRKENGRSRLAGRLLAAAVVSVTLAQGVEAAKYDVKHTFELKPKGNVVPRVTASYYAHSFIQEKKGDCEDFAIVPAGQGANWNAYGKDILRNRGRVRNRSTTGRYHDAANGMVASPAAGLSAAYQAFTFGCLSWADAHCEIDVNPFAAGGKVSGTIRSWGEARAALRPPRKSKAYAFSMTMVEAQGGKLMRNGRIKWRKVVRDVVAGRAGSRRQVDPIDYTVTDLVTGEVFQGTLYSVVLETKAGAGGFTWENDEVTLGALDATFKVEFPSGYLTSMQGLLDLEVKNGEVTKSVATGNYLGILPPVGTRVPIVFPLSNEVEFDYDLGDHDDHDLDVNLEFNGSGEALEEKAADPELTVTRTPGTDPSGSPTVTLTWPPQNVPVVVQKTRPLPTGPHWIPITVTPQLVSGLHEVTLPVQPGRAEFFRLETQEEFVTDQDPPKFLAEGICGEPMVLINFTEPVVPELAQDPFFYMMIDPLGQPHPVLDAQMLDPQTVMLFLEQPLRLELQLQAVILGGITDLAGNEIRPNYLVPVDCEGQGDAPGRPGEPPFPGNN